MNKRTIKRQDRERKKKLKKAIMQRRLKEKSGNRGLSPELQAIRGILPPMKVSEMITQIAEPMLNEAEYADECKTIIQMTIMAWNLSLLEENGIDKGHEDKCEEFVEKLASKLKQRLAPDMTQHADEVVETIKFLMDRKLLLFPNVVAFIEDVQFEVSDDSSREFYFEVLYSLPTSPRRRKDR